MGGMGIAWQGQTLRGKGKEEGGRSESDRGCGFFGEKRTFVAATRERRLVPRGLRLMLVAALERAEVLLIHSPALHSFLPPATGLRLPSYEETRKCECSRRRGRP